MTQHLKNVNSRSILQDLPGYNMQRNQKSKGFNMDFQRYNPPLAYKIQKQDEEGGAVAVMLVALLIGVIVAAIVL